MGDTVTCSECGQVFALDASTYAGVSAGVSGDTPVFQCPSCGGFEAVNPGLVSKEAARV